MAGWRRIDHLTLALVAVVVLIYVETEFVILGWRPSTRAPKTVKKFLDALIQQWEITIHLPPHLTGRA
jgi:hypothetical protein